MANTWEINQIVDLQKGIDKVEVWPHALLFIGDKNAHTWNVAIMNGGAPANISGGVTGYFIRQDGTTVYVAGSLSDNVASVTFDDDCYAFEGDLKAMMRIATGDSVITISALLFQVRYGITDQIVDPGKVIPSIDELLAQIENIRSAAEAANSATEKANAAASNVETATKKANDAASKANSASTDASNAAKAANEAAAKAEEAASKNKLYDSTGTATDGAMTQKATTDEINNNANAIARRMPVAYDFGGARLNNVFANAAEFKSAVDAGDFSNIHIGDYWDIKLNGTFRDYGSYSIPRGVQLYNDDDCLIPYTTQNLADYREAIYFSNTAVTLQNTQGIYYYAKSADCLPYFERTCNNAVMLLEIAAINPYWRYGNSGSLSGAVNHVLFVSRDCLPFTMRMRKANTVWEDTTTQNPWIGSALYKTLNDPDYGVVKLIKATDIGAYMYDGSDGNGMRYYGETRSSVTATTSSGAWTSRGKLFLPTEDEIWGRAIYTLNNACGHTRLPIFDGSCRHISKGIGNGASRAVWWCMSACAGNATNFCNVGSYGFPNNYYAADLFGAPVCFIVAQ